MDFELFIELGSADAAQQLAEQVVAPEPAKPATQRKRVGDADRWSVEERLSQAYQHGYLTQEEMNERIAALWPAKWHDDLAALTADLPDTPCEDLVPGMAQATQTRPRNVKMALALVVAVAFMVIGQAMGQTAASWLWLIVIMYITVELAKSIRKSKK
jgi:hypothetical protein